MSRKVNVGSSLLFLVGLFSLLFGLFSTFLPSSVMTSNEDLHGMTVSEIHKFNPELVNYIERYHQLYGLYLISFALLLCVISLIPFRRGEKWAWYTMMVIGGIALFSTLLLSRKIVAVRLNLFLIMLWISGIVLPAKEILSKPSI